MAVVMNDPSFQLLVLVIGLMGYALVLAVLRTLSARVSLVLARHDLLAESKRRRLEFMREAEARRQMEDGGAAVIADEPSDVIIEDDPPLRAAA